MVSQWGHLRLFSPWKYNIDQAARALLEPSGWSEPEGDPLPTGAELVDGYLGPLAATPQLREKIRTRTRVIAVTRVGMDRTLTPGRDEAPFLIRTEDSHGKIDDHWARAVIDASGTWGTPNPLGQAGLPAVGEDAARMAGLVTPPLPDVLGRDRAQFSDLHTLVVGADPSSDYGGGEQDGLSARGALGTRLRRLVDDGGIDIHTSAATTDLVMADARSSGELTLVGTIPDGELSLSVNRVVPTTGFRPDLGLLREIRLDLDPIVEAPSALGPLIDPEYHSCGTVEPHGARLLEHPESGFYIAGMKSYGRAPTFLMVTGYEQVRSIAAAIAGDRTAADRVDLALPETGVCFSGIPTGLTHGRAAARETE